MNFIDLFAGAGGLSEGFIRAGFSPIAHVEIDAAACFTLKTRMAFHYLKREKQINFYKAYLKGIITREMLYSVIPDEILNSVINIPIGEETNNQIFSQIDTLLGNEEVDVMVGGPPCQAYSVIGRAVDKNGMKDDKRNFLYRHYARFLRRYNPRIFVFENVLGLLSAGNGMYLDNMLAYFKSIGYDAECHVQNAADFGVLQTRKRVLIIGWKKELDFSYPSFRSAKHRYKVKALFSDLPELQDGEGEEKAGKYSGAGSKYVKKYFIRNGIGILAQHVTRPHIERDKEIYSIAVEKWNNEQERLVYSDLPAQLITHKNTEDFQDRFKVVAGDLKTSHTVLAHIAKDGHYYIHPDKKQNRSLSVREAARVQSFPDDYFFEGEKEKGSRTSAFKQIGNAVPPLMATAIARAIKNWVV